MRSLKDHNIDAIVQPKSPINEVIQDYYQDEIELPPEEKRMSIELEMKMGENQAVIGRVRNFLKEDIPLLEANLDLCT